MNLVKRSLDLGGSLVLLAALGPLLAAAALAVRLTSPGPVLFRQRRLGRGARPFMIFKFRTMVAGAEGGSPLLHRDDPRITPLGRWFRTCRLDELPQLLNVLRGEMSLVGPRPLLPEFLPYYSDFDRRRLEATPGMTGWQQVNGASRHGWGERVALDVWYVDHQSLLLDLRILLLTVGVVLRGDSAYAPDGSQTSGLPDGYPRETDAVAGLRPGTVWGSLRGDVEGA